MAVCIALLPCLGAHATAIGITVEADTAKEAPPFDDTVVERERLFNDDEDVDEAEVTEEVKETKSTKDSKKKKKGKSDSTADSLKTAKKAPRDWANWRPDPKRAMWLAIVLPGAGQIYNRKYWKLPIIYGGFLGCAYAMRWNNQQYHDYSQAYLDLMDDDANTQSYNQFLHLGNRINDLNKAQWEKVFKRRKDYYRRYRDMSFFIMVGVYAISIIDAYVDASLAQFDISDDLSLRVEPTVINSSNYLSARPTQSSALGLQCSINF